MQQPVGRRLILIAFVLAVGCVARQPKPAMVDTAAITATIDSLGKAFSSAAAARDTSAIVNFYADDAHVLPPGAARIQGKEGIHHLWAGFLSMPGLELGLHTDNVIVSEAGDLAAEVGSYTLRAQDPTGKPFDDAGKYLVVWKNMNGAWKILADTWNTDRPMPGM